ncbi:FG-GAP-like repeat-containing protein [[Actinomadura] parvosata]|uniref:FG-GAP-like repeat-containing protein n=1 Tax=[Actinomadura] parvosata TaxID=1955412 RepID=UPI0016475D3E|nr:FG-GAP-like repeat-containing protein [Nonomuraea sp. ATCC 55076]
MTAVLVLSSLVLVSADRQEPVAAEVPLGGLVDSAPNFGWTRGEFSVSHDGAARYSMPLWVPAGRGAVTPRLSLSYSSRAGNGLLGVGWSIGGLSAISWCGRTIAQDGYTDGGHFDGADSLCFGGDRLVPISPQWSPQREYRTERESFARIIAYETQDNVPNSFKVFTKDGKILTFGGGTNARVQPYQLVGSANMAEPSLTRAPGAPRATTAWALDRIEDRNGNAAVIEYTRTEGDATGLWWMELRPKRIHYAPNRTVEFFYDHDRPDEIDGFVGGTHTRTAARMSRIEMWGGPQDGAAELLRQYKLRYQSNSITRRSLLSSVTECDRDQKCKVPLPFEYSLGSYSFETIDVDDDVAVGNAPSVSVVDVNGDGRNDLLLDHNGRKELRISRRSATGDGFAAPKPSGLPLARQMQMLDIDADGRTEVLAEVSDGLGYRYQLFRSTYKAATGWSFEAVPGNLGQWRPSTSSSQPVYLADLDGNGLPDFIETAYRPSPRWSYRLNTGALGVTRFTPEVEPTIGRNLAAIGNYAVDTDGDGRTELISSRQFSGAPGWVSWGRRASGDLTASGDVQVRLLNLRGLPTSTHFGDVNGDGLVDSVLPHQTDTNRRNELRVQLNSGNGFGSRFTTQSPPGYQEPQYPASLVDVGVRVVDFNGDGCDDVLVFHAGKPKPGDTWRGLQVYLWRDNAFVRAPLDLDIGSPLGAFWDNTQILDLNGDGALDLVNAGPDGQVRVFKRSGGMPDQLTAIGKVSSRGRTEISYTTLADRAVHTPGSRTVDSPATCSYPLACPISGGSVVASHSVTSNFGTGTAPTWDSYRHTYKAAQTDLHGRGWLGFAEHTVTRTTTGAGGAATVTEFDNTTFDPDIKTYPFAQLPKKETYTVRDMSAGTGREFRSTTINGYASRRRGNTTYTEPFSS